MSSLLFLFLFLSLTLVPYSSSQPTLDPRADDLVISETLPFKVQPLGGDGTASFTARINRCDQSTVGVTLNVIFGSTNKNYTLTQNSSTISQTTSLPSSVCSSDGTATFSINQATFKYGPSYLQIEPVVDFVCRGIKGKAAPRKFSIGADCSSQRDCTSCSELKSNDGSTPCGWCPDTQRCYPYDPSNNYRPYCFIDCTQGLYRKGQCPLASTEAAWTTNKTIALAVVLGICIPLIVIAIVCCIRQRRKKVLAAGATSGVGTIQARTQGYRQGVAESVSERSTTDAPSETSINGVNSNAEFRQMEAEGYNPPRVSTAV